MNDWKKPAWKKTEERPSREPELRPLEVVVRNNDIEDAIKVLRHKISKDGILTELKVRRNAEKPSDKKRREKREAAKKQRRSRGKKARQRTQNFSKR